MHFRRYGPAIVLETYVTFPVYNNGWHLLSKIIHLTNSRTSQSWPNFLWFEWKSWNKASKHFPNVSHNLLGQLKSRITILDLFCKTFNCQILMLTKKTSPSICLHDGHVWRIDEKNGVRFWALRHFYKILIEISNLFARGAKI